jgi:2,4-dienoyl-CoA reductase-like NADH-dependent reductase (Old Yellow Enzyme family)
MSASFTPYRLGSLELRNRIVIAPMCQYSAQKIPVGPSHQVPLAFAVKAARTCRQSRSVSSLAMKLI